MLLADQVYESQVEIVVVVVVLGVTVKFKVSLLHPVGFVAIFKLSKVTQIP